MIQFYFIFLCLCCRSGAGKAVSWIKPVSKWVSFISVALFKHIGLKVLHTRGNKDYETCQRYKLMSAKCTLVHQAKCLNLNYNIQGTVAVKKDVFFLRKKTFTFSSLPKKKHISSASPEIERLHIGVCLHRCFLKCISSRSTCDCTEHRVCG